MRAMQSSPGDGALDYCEPHAILYFVRAALAAVSFVLLLPNCCPMKAASPLASFYKWLAFSSTVITALTLLYLTLPRKVEPLRKSRLRSLCSVCCTNFLVNALPETTSCGDYPGATCGRLATLMGWLETTAIAVLLLISALTLVAIGLGVSGASARGCYCCPYSSTCCSRGSVAGRDSGSGGGEGEQRW